MLAWEMLCSPSDIFSQKASALINPQNEKRKNSNSFLAFFVEGFWPAVFQRMYYYEGLDTTEVKLLLLLLNGDPKSFNTWQVNQSSIEVRVWGFCYCGVWSFQGTSVDVGKPLSAVMVGVKGLLQSPVTSICSWLALMVCFSLGGELDRRS